MRRFLFVHPNFPAQFVHLAQALSRLGHEVWALAESGHGLPGVRWARYVWQPPAAVQSPGLIAPVQQQLARAVVAAGAMAELRAQGVMPDVIVAHPGWGDATLAKDIWPRARLAVYAEFFYQAEGADVGFDPEYTPEGFAAAAVARLRNTAMLHALAQADLVFTPTQWQKSLLPAVFQTHCHVAFEGIDTTLACPDSSAQVYLDGPGITLGCDDEVITFVNRNFEPYRGFHVFMRALPEVLARRPKAHVLLVGGDSHSYGPPPAGGGSWREALLREVGGSLPMERVHFMGVLPHEQYLKVIQVSACHVHLTYPFVMSWSAVEAMSVGCALVASDTAPVREFVRHGQEGLLVDFFDRGALAGAVCEVLAEPQRFRPMREAARKRVIDKFDLHSRCLPRLLDMLLGA